MNEPSRQLDTLPPKSIEPVRERLEHLAWEITGTTIHTPPYRSPDADFVDFSFQMLPKGAEGHRGNLRSNLRLSRGSDGRYRVTSFTPRLYWPGLEKEAFGEAAETVADLVADVSPPVPGTNVYASRLCGVGKVLVGRISFMAHPELILDFIEDFLPRYLALEHALTLGDLPETWDRGRKASPESQNRALEPRTDEAVAALEHDPLVELRLLKGHPTWDGAFGTGTVRIVRPGEDFGRFSDGDVLVTSELSPALAPALHKASAVITERARRYKKHIPHGKAILGEKKPVATGAEDATILLSEGQEVTVCGGWGHVDETIASDGARSASHTKPWNRCPGG